jgi:hypothetical protein
MTDLLDVSSCVIVREGCPISHTVIGSAETEFLCGNHSDGFAFTFEAEALREFLRLGTEALREMDAQFAQEEAERAAAG